MSTLSGYSAAEASMARRRRGSRDTKSLVGDDFCDHRLFRVLPREVLRDTAERLVERRYARGAQIYVASDRPPGVYLVRSGLVGLTESDARGSVYAIQICSTGDVFGLATAAFGVAQELSASVLVDTEVYMLDHSVFHDLYARYPDFAHQTSLEIYTKLRRSERSVVVSRMPVPPRIAAFLLESVGEHAEVHTFDLEFSHQQLALLLGTTRETVTRMLARLSKAGVIAIHGRSVRILRTDALRRLADS